MSDITTNRGMQAVAESDFVRMVWPSLDHTARSRAVRARLRPSDPLRSVLLELLEGPTVRIADGLVFVDRGSRARRRRR
jgi:hypothetical protein